MLLSRCSRPHRRSPCLQVEALEERTLPAVTFSVPPDLHPTVDQAENLSPTPSSPSPPQANDLDGVGTVTATGTIDLAPGVDWYSFTLSAASHVTLSLGAGNGSSFVGTLSLYDQDPDAVAPQRDANSSFGPSDPYNPLGYRLLQQAQGTGGADATVSFDLAAGTYYFAVSGAGNTDFNPLLAGSGYNGSTGAYQAVATATPLTITGNPVILATELEAGAAITDPSQTLSIDHSPVVVRVDFSGAVDPALLVAGSTVQLTDANSNPVLFATHYSPDTNQLALSLAAPLAPGTYTLSVQGFSALGQSTDYLAAFTVTGIEGGAAADDTAATAHALGDISNGGLVSARGFIGDDPYYSFFNDPSTWLTPSDNYAGADVDMYRFTISGPGTHAFLAEVDAGRIGSPLNPGVSLFRLESDGLHLITANDDSNNGAVTNVDPLTGSTFAPLLQDAVLYAGLTEGTYVLAVSSGPNTPDPVLGRQVGLDPSDPNYDPNNPVFDPNLSHSGQPGPGDSNGFTTGAYVLNLRVLPSGEAPRVVAVTPAEGPGPLAPPSQITVQFSKPVNIAQLAYQGYGLSSVDRLDAVYVVGPDGRYYYPRLQAWDAATNTATFLLLDALPTGANELHLSGALGLTDYAGNPLAGNDPSGDYVVHFSVYDPLHPIAGTPLNLTDQEPNNVYTQAQQFGTLFAATDLQQGVTITRDLSGNAQAAAQDTGTDCYQFTVSQTRQYTFTLVGSGLPAGTAPLILDASGTPVFGAQTVVGSGVAFMTQLTGGQTYYVYVGGWDPAQAQAVKYQLRISIGQSSENPTPLSFGPAPLVSIRPVNSAPLPPISLPLPPGSTSPTTPALFGGTGLLFLPNAFLPGSLLLAGPVGGLPTTGGGDQVVTLASLPSLELALGEPGLQVLVSTLLTSTGGDRGVYPMSGPAAGFDEWPPQLQQALDLLFRMTDWLQVLPADPGAVPGTGPTSTAPEDSDVEGAAGWEADEAAVIWAGDGAAPEGGNWGWAAAAAAVALQLGPAAGWRDRRRSRPRGPARLQLHN